MSDCCYEGWGTSGRKLTRSDMALLRTALRKKWGVPDHLRNESLYLLHGVLEDERANLRDKLAAVKLLKELDDGDRDEERLEILKRHAARDHDDKPDILDYLGDRPGVPE
jgi:hypothetical protein